MTSCENRQLQSFDFATADMCEEKGYIVFISPEFSFSKTGQRQAQFARVLILKFFSLTI